jgi:hypothetical protein
VKLVTWYTSGVNPCPTASMLKRQGVFDHKFVLKHKFGLDHNGELVIVKKQVRDPSLALLNSARHKQGIGNGKA